MRSSVWGAGLAFVLLVAGAAGWWQTGARWRGPLYCFEQAGLVWGLSPIPAGVAASCPESRTVRAEVRAGRARLEQFTLPGWAPDTLMRPLLAGGFTVLRALPDDGVQVEAILTRGQERVLYTAAHQGEGTFVTLSRVGRD
ncbi:hypothetical protein LAJ19_07485 [Deinococcus taeanensis]|uniref:hypothetical protein n=1 Tax=Deinococcus taeanensis TaxID=2737050 RepID=UPI001CDC9315|nr:hypothetical protein [Deinococcus taeanensis]UBV41512.1 hypothetical protein LAJ19_07485 [Deinococcus taeanensis]